MLFGLYSKYAKHGPTNSCTDSCYSTETQSLEFGAEVVSVVRDIGSHPTRTAFHSPKQNRVAERSVGNCRHELLLNKFYD
jgi:hypothetical protein